MKGIHGIGALMTTPLPNASGQNGQDEEGINKVFPVPQRAVTWKLVATLRVIGVRHDLRPWCIPPETTFILQVSAIFLPAEANLGRNNRKATLQGNVPCLDQRERSEGRSGLEERR